jgi:MinD superfamily P-loop ATPase
VNISRKDFFRESLLSLGEAICKAGDVLKQPAVAERTIPENKEFVPGEREEMKAVAHNEHCLAKSCGCFACEESCESHAIVVAMGEGIRIDASLCTGCGACEYVCPVTPKAVTMVPGI